MIVGRTIAAVTAAVALATATMLCVAAAACALFWVLEPVVGRAGSAALLSGLLALIVAISVLIAVSRPSRPARASPETGQTDFGFIDRIIGMAKDRPLLSLGAALAAGLIAVRNPALVATIVAAFMDKPQNRA